MSAKQTKIVTYRGHEFTFMPGVATFGSDIVMIFPKHGDFGCMCLSCDIYRFVERWQDKGYYLSKMTEIAKNEN